jgi:anti-sigma-K factor RskA
MSLDRNDNTAGMPPDLYQQAGEYVIGTLTAEDRRMMEARLQHDDALRVAVQAWEARLLPLTALVEPVTPSARLWQRIERSVEAAAVPASMSKAAVTPMAPATSASAPVRSATPESSLRRWIAWNSIGMWRFLTAGSLATAGALAVVLATRIAAPAPGPQYMVVLVAPQDKAPGWVIQAGLSRQINLIPLAAAVVPQDKALQFWTKGEGWSGPVSLGLVEPGHSVQIPLDKLPPLQPNQLFELTLEPSTGSPIGKPTGPVQFIGRAVKVM